MGIVELFGRRMIKAESVLEFLEKIFIGITFSILVRYSKIDL